MKKTLLIILCVFVSLISFAGDGSINSPLSVKEMKAKSINSNTKYYVEGYVVGEYEAYSNNKMFYEMSPVQDSYDGTPSFGGYVFIIADSPEEYDINNCLVIQFPTTSTSDYALDVRPYFWRKLFSFHGTHETYNGADGMKKIDEYAVISNSIDDETVVWTYTETFEKGSSSSKNNKPYEYSEFIPYDSDDKWQGGTFNHYYNDGYMYDDMLVYSYKITTGLVDDSKPKWDDQAVCLRNENAALELVSTIESGIGEIEFWAGNYENYSTAKLSFTLEYSADGKTWQDIASDVAVPMTNKSTTNGMTLFRYKVNKSDAKKIRITKTDSNIGKGLQIDNLKISQYIAPTALQNISDDEIIVSVENNSIEVKNKQSGTLCIYTILGQQVYTSSVVEATSTNIYLPHGLYILKFNNKTKKIKL